MGKPTEKKRTSSQSTDLNVSSLPLKKKAKSTVTSSLQGSSGTDSKKVGFQRVKTWLLGASEGELDGLPS